MWCALLQCTVPGDASRYQVKPSHDKTTTSVVFAPRVPQKHNLKYRWGTHSYPIAQDLEASRIASHTLIILAALASSLEIAWSWLPISFANLTPPPPMCKPFYLQCSWSWRAPDTPAPSLSLLTAKTTTCMSMKYKSCLHMIHKQNSCVDHVILCCLGADKRPCWVGQ